MKNVRVKVVESCFGNFWWYTICEGKRQIWTAYGYERKYSAIRAAKAIAKRIGIKYDPEIIKQHGC